MRNVCSWQRAWVARIVLAAGVMGAACGLPLQRGIAAKPSGGGGGGGNGGGLTNPAWVVVDGNGIKLLAYDGVTTQTLLKAGRQERFNPMFSPDGNWIAYVQRDSGVNQLYRMRVDGSSNQRLTSFTSQSLASPYQFSGMQWVPGEIDRIVYVGLDYRVYVYSTLTGAVRSIAGVGDTPSLSRDLDPATPGYQGAVAWTAFNTATTPESVDIFLGLLVDTPQGLALTNDPPVVLELPDNQGLPSWSNDAQSLAFLDRAASGSGELLRVAPVTVDLQGIGILEPAIMTLEDRPAGIYYRPVWSPDDESLAYVGQVGAAPGGGKLLDLFRVSADGSSAPVNVTNSHVDAITTSNRFLMPHWNPRWSP